MIYVDYLLLGGIALLIISILFYLHKYVENKNYVLLFSLVITFSGLSFILLPNKISPVFGVPLILVGSYFYSLNSVNLDLSFSNYNELPNWTFYFGIFIILANIIYTYFLGDKSWGSIDRGIILVGILWSSFNYFPTKYSKLRDFIFIFANIFVFLVIVPLLFDILQPERNSTFSDIFISKFLAKPLSLTLNLMGYETLNIGSKFYYKNIDGDYNSVSIAWVCSGIQSLIVFVSAFFSYTIVEYRRMNAVMLNLLFLGAIVSYVANILRMVIIIVVGYYYGLEALYWTHTNIGWIIFTLWFGLFWHFAFRHIDKSLEGRGDLI